MKIRVLITGSAGYIGNVFTQKLQEGITGYEFFALDKEIDKKNELSKNTGPYPYKDTLKSCISRPEVKDWLIKNNINTIIHLADKSLGAFKNEQDVHENVSLHRSFLKICEQIHKEKGVLAKIIYASSCSVYGYQEKLLDEKSPTSPTSYYAKSKLEIEELIKSLPFEKSILRFGTAFGYSPSLRKDLLVNQILINHINGENIELFDINSCRPYIHTKDFVNSLLFILDQKNIELVNSLEVNLSKKELVDIIENAIERKILTSLVENKVDIRNYRVSNEKLKSLGLKYEMGFKEGVKDLFQRITT